jgi:hypothetical protein
VHGTRSAEGEQDKLAGIEATLNGHDADGSGHVAVRNVDDPKSRIPRIQAERAAEAFDGKPGGFRVKR